MKINLDDTKTTLRLNLRLKKKAHALAEAQGLSFNQFIESLIEGLNESPGAPSLQQQIAEIQKKIAGLDEKMSQMKGKKA